MAFSGSSAFVDTLRYGSYLVATRATVYTNGVSTQIELPTSVASITVSRSSAYRRSGSLTAEIIPDIPPPPLLPTTPESLLAPFGTEIFLESGIVDATGNTTYVPLGLFDIATTTVDDTSIDLIVTLSLYDRSWTIAQRAFKQPYNFPATTSGNFVAEIMALLNQVWGQNPKAPPLIYNITPTSAVVPVASYNQGSNPWQAALDMAAAVGYELFFNALGEVVGYPIPNPATQPIVWNFTDNPTAIFGDPGTGSQALLGAPYSTPIAVQSTMTRDQIYNDVIIQGTGAQNVTGATSGAGALILAEAMDTNPLSPTYVNGGMGDIPEFITTNLTTGNNQAQAMANNTLTSALSAAWQIEITAAPNPIFDIDDVVTITRPRIGINNVNMVLDTITHVVNFADMLQLTGRVIL